LQDGHDFNFLSGIFFKLINMSDQNIKQARDNARLVFESMFQNWSTPTDDPLRSLEEDAYHYNTVTIGEGRQRPM